MRHFLTTQGLTQERFETLLARGEEFRKGASSEALAGQHVGLVFFDPSLRTRVSMEVAVSQLGGTPVTLSVGGEAWAMEYEDGTVMDGAAAEHVREGAGVLGRYCDMLGVRSFPRGDDYAKDRAEPVLLSFVRHSGVPVVNLESTLSHPCQAMADAMTLSQRLNRTDLDTEILREAEENARQAGGSLTLTEDPGAYDGVEVVYAKSWGSLADYGHPEAEASRRAKLKDWRVTEERMARGRNAFFMHCLPVRRNVVVDDEILDGPRSAVLDEAENRLYAQEAILEWLAKENR